MSESEKKCAESAVELGIDHLSCSTASVISATDINLMDAMMPQVNPPSTPRPLTAPDTDVATAPGTDIATAPDTGLVTAPDTDLATAPDTDQATAPDTDQATAPDTDLETAPDTDQATAPDTDLATAPDTDLATAPDTDQATAPDTVLATAPDTDQATAPDTDLATAPDTDLATAPDTDQATAPDTDQATAPDTDQATAPDTDQATAPDTDLATAPDTDLATAPDTDLATAPDTDLTTAPDTDQATAPDTDLATAPDTDLATAPDTDLATAPDTDPETAPATNESAVPEEDCKVAKMTKLLDDVVKLEEVWEGFSLMEEHAVAKENCFTLQDMKDRLTLHFKQQLGQARTAHDADAVLSELQERDSKRRAELVQLMGSLEALIGQLDEQVLQHLEGEGTGQQELSTHVKRLRSNQCPILVTGETSSGKSSLLNLLLGQDALPHSLLSCTSCMCRLGYGETPSARAHGVDGRVTDIALDGNVPLRKQLEQYIFQDKQRDEEFPYDEVEIFLPLHVLKTGVYIIDSPGFGENPAMDQKLMNFITHNEILGFVYVIKSDNAGGVQEDRLERILKYIVAQHSGESVSRFNPRAAIFVCNRWDLVPESERELIQKDTFTKLKRCWPELKESQIFYMSTTKAWTNRQAGYISEDYSLFLDGIQRLIPAGLNSKVFHSYRWMEHVLKRLRHHVTSYLASTRMSHKELKSRHAAAQLRLHKVEKEADVIMKKLNKKIDKNVRQISKKLAEFLDSDQAKMRFELWTLDELPPVQEEDVWGEIEPQIDSVIERRLQEVLRGWDLENRLFQRVRVELLFGFQEEFLLIENQLTTVEQCLQNSSVSLRQSSPSNEDYSRYAGITQNVGNPTDTTFDFNLDFLQKLAIGIATPILLPVALGIIVGAPIFLLWDLKKWRRRSLSLKNLVSYVEDPVGFVTLRAQLLVSKVADLDNVSQYVSTQLEPARLYIDSMRAAIPRLVESNRNLMDSIVKDRRTSNDIEKRYSRFEALIPDMQEKLAAFGNKHIREYDFKMEQLRIVVPPTGGYQPKKVTGIWTEVISGELQKSEDATAKKVAAKAYLDTSSISAIHLANEEQYFRRARHPSIAPLLGSMRSDNGMPWLVFESSLVPARQELFGFRALARASQGRSAIMERSARMLDQVGIGLEYLHYRALVHIELSLDTVMVVPKKDTVRLTQLSEPRCVQLPDDPGHVTAGPWVYLAPEVLEGATYTSASDMYSLGVMAWELGTQKLAFKPQRNKTLREFTATKPSLGSDNSGDCNMKEKNKAAKVRNAEEEENGMFCHLVKGCVSQDPSLRMCSTTWVNEIRKMYKVGPNEDREEEK